MASISLLQHYLEYVSSPAVLLVIISIAGPIFFEIYWRKNFTHNPAPRKIPGCFRLGLSKRSNLEGEQRPKRRKDQPDKKDRNPVNGTGRVQALFTYPVKSCRGVELAASEIGSAGLKYDRMFTFAQLVSRQDDSNTSTNPDAVNETSTEWKHDWHFITQREFPRLALLNTELWVPDPRRLVKVEANASKKRSKQRRKAVEEAEKEWSGTKVEQEESQASDEDNVWADNGGCVIITFPYEPDFNPFALRTERITIALPLSPTKERAEANNYSYESLNIWKDSPQAINMSEEASSENLAKLKYFLGVSNPLAIFRIDDSNKRAVTRSLPQDQPDHDYSVGFADAFPFHLINTDSVKALDGKAADDGSKKKKENFDARRFRANVYVTGPVAYDEDTWKRITVGRCIKHRKEVGKDRSSDRNKLPVSQDRQMVEMDGEYHVACRTARCTLPNVDPDSGVKDPKEPFATLSKSRKVDKGAYPHPVLGMQMIPLFQQGILRVGDEITVLERGEHVYEKMFA